MDIRRACREGDLERVRQLIQDGQDVNRGNRYGWTPLMLAAANGHNQVMHMVRELIRAGADVNGQEVQTNCPSQGQLEGSLRCCQNTR